MKRGKLTRKVPVAAPPAEDRPQRVPLRVRWGAEERWFIAVHEGGYGAAQCPAEAILAAQESVMFDEQPGQLLLYVASAETAPTGYVEWPDTGNGAAQPKLVGCTNTHQGWIRRRNLNEK